MKRPIAFALVLTIVCFLSGSAWSANGKFNAESYSSPKIRDLYLVIIRDPDAQLLALQRGQADILGDLHRPVDVDTLADDPRVNLSLASGFHGFFLGFNVRTFPWNRLELRQAA